MSNEYDLAEVAQRLLTVREASESFMGYVKAMRPGIVIPDFQRELIEILDRAERDELYNDHGKKVRRILVNMPPRHGKSTFATELFPSYYIARKAYREIMSVSYNAELAKTFGRNVREYTRSSVIKQSFPEFTLSEESRAVDVWKTTVGGVYYGVGLGGTTTGRGANLLIVDDPIKARQEAESPTVRNTVWSYYVSALLTRKQPDRDRQPALEIVILTRWHPDDLAGRIMETEEWKRGEWMHVNFEARKTHVRKVSRKELPEDDPEYLPPSFMLSTITESRRFKNIETTTALWPERFPLEELERIERMNPREFASLYMQSPYVAGGNVIKSGWWRFWDELPERFHSLIITSDTAFKKTESADYSVLLVAGVSYTGDIYILDVIRGKYNFPELKRISTQVNTKWRGRGLRGLYVEDKASGQSLIQELRMESGIAIIPYKLPPGDKVSRANSVTPIIEGGRVYLPQTAPWLDDFMTEMQQFPSSKHDDQVDALVMAVDILSRVVLPNDDALNGAFDASLSPNRKIFDSMSAQNIHSKKLSSGIAGWGE